MTSKKRLPPIIPEPSNLALNTNPDPLHPSLALLAKLGSIAVHAEEWLSDNRHQFDFEALAALLNDPDIKGWVKAMGVYLPKKR